MASALTQIKEIWGRLPLAGRIVVIAAALSTLTIIGILVYYTSQSDYGVLFSDLKPTDAQSIIEKLKAANVPYSLTNGGTTISVPTEKVAELRLKMAADGVLSGGHVGFDLFDKTNFGTTDFAQQVNYRRAIEGELAKTLEGMDEVEAARVHLTPKKESIFTDKEEGAKASVMLRVRQGRELSQERTEAIVSLIASSIEGLDPSNISVMDTRGRLLTSQGRAKGGAYGDAGAFNAQLTAKQKYEQETAARIIVLLEPITGEGRVRADVSADVDFSQVEQTEEKYNPQSQVVRSQQTSQETKNSNGQNPQGVAGARSNNPTTANANTTANTTTQNANLTDQKVMATTNYEIDKTTRRTIGGGGRVNRLSVSVVVDHKMVEGVLTARTPEEVQKFQELVSAAVGADQQRGDQVVVQTMPFDQPTQPEAATPTWLDKYKPYIPSAIRYGTLALVALLLYWFVIRPARKALKTAAKPPEEPKQLATANNSTAAENSKTETPFLEAAKDKENEDESRRDEDEEGRKLLEPDKMPQLKPMMTVAELEAAMEAELIHEISNIDSDTQRAQAMKKLLSEQTLREPEIITRTIRSWLRE